MYANVKCRHRLLSYKKNKWIKNKNNESHFIIPNALAKPVSATSPGAMPTTRTLFGPHSTAQCFVNASETNNLP